MQKLIPTILVFIIALSTGCSQSPKPNEDYLVTIHTDFGDMKVILYDETPLHKENFIKLAKSGKYDSTVWHRVIENFMIQGGDVYKKEGKQEPKGSEIPAEIVDGFYHHKGALAAARQGDQVNPEKKSSSCQFYIVHGKKFSKEELTVDQYKLNMSLSSLFQDSEYDSLKSLFIELLERRATEKEFNELALSLTGFVEEELGVSLTKEISDERLEIYTALGGTPHLDNEYTVFGKVIAGLDVIDKVAAVEKSRGDVPVKPTGMAMEVEILKKKKITKLYGYQYPESKK